MPRALFIVILAVLFTIHLVLLDRASRELRHLPTAGSESYTVPAPVLKISALEFDSLASDFLYLKALIFIGSTYERPGKSKVKDWEMKWLYSMFDVATDLDPYFLDPYLLANSNLTWGAGMIQEANTLLQKGARYRDWDWTLPFFMGFNYFYFLQENDKASEYLMEASRRPGASPMYAELAAKLAFKSQRTETAIFFMEELLNKTDDIIFIKEYETRLELLRNMLLLENAVNAYKKKSGRIPRHLDDLIKKGIIQTIPKDPYGGEFYIDPQGAVKTTSESLLVPYRH